MMSWNIHVHRGSLNFNVYRLEISDQAYNNSINANK